MEADDVSLNPADYKPSTLGKFYLTFMKYLQAPFDCGASVSGNSSAIKKILPCYDSTASSTMEPYQTLHGTNVPYSYLDDGQIALQDGTLLLFENNSSANIDYVWIHVDLNGYNRPPNRWGYDLFTFEFLDGELRTMGDKETKYNDIDKYCSLKSTQALNGIACAYRAKTESDYFKWAIKNLK